MEAKKLLDKADNLQENAITLVNSLGIEEIANKYAECHQIGSSRMGLMVDEDIDFTCYVKNKVDTRNCMDFAHELITTTPIKVIRLKNYLDDPQYKQFKVYVDNYPYKNSHWKIAFSFQLKTDFLVKVEIEKIEWVISKVNPDNRLLILQLKSLARERHVKIPGALIYSAVLEHDICEFDNLLKFAEKNKKRTEW